MMCDLARSIFPDKPIANNETHNFPVHCAFDVDGQFIYAAQLAEMLHGRNAGVMWTWEIDFHSPWGSYAFTRANCFHAASRAALDSRRLSQEIAAFRSVPRQFAIFYSIPSFSDTGHYTRLSNLYQGAFFHGVTPGFVTERQLANADWRPDVRLVLAPDTRRVEERTFQALERLVDAGVTVVRFGEQCLGQDEYGHDVAARKPSLARMVCLPIQEPEQYFPVLRDLFRRHGVAPRHQVTGENGEPLWALEFRCSADGALLYAMNWARHPQHIRLPKGVWQELFDERPSAPERTMQPLEVRLFRRCDVVSDAGN